MNSTNRNSNLKPKSENERNRKKKRENDANQAYKLISWLSAQSHRTAQHFTTPRTHTSPTRTTSSSCCAHRSLSRGPSPSAGLASAARACGMCAWRTDPAGQRPPITYTRCTAVPLGSRTRVFVLDAPAAGAAHAELACQSRGG
jgi:hypothetical protein